MCNLRLPRIKTFQLNNDLALPGKPWTSLRRFQANGIMFAAKRVGM